MRCEQTIEDVMNDGKRSANGRRFGSGFRKITDNPYDRMSRKKEHIAWHNAFFDECKRIGRSVML